MRNMDFHGGPYKGQMVHVQQVLSIVLKCSEDCTQTSTITNEVLLKTNPLGLVMPQKKFPLFSPLKSPKL